MILPVNVILGVVPVVKMPCAQPFDEGGTNLYVATADDTLYKVFAVKAVPLVGRAVACAAGAW